MSLFTDYFTQYGISISNILNSFSDKVNSRFFDLSSMVDLTIDVSDNTTYDYTLLSYDGYLIQNLYTGTPTRFDVNGLTINPTPVELLTDTDNPNETGIFEYARYGTHFLLKNTDTARVLHIRAKIVKKDASSMLPSVYDKLEELYYYLSINDSNGVYTTLRALSNAKKNCIAKNVHNRPIQRASNFTVNGISLRT